MLAFQPNPCNVRRMNFTFFAVVDYNQSILAFILFLGALVPQIFIYLNTKKSLNSTEKIEKAVDGAKTTLEGKITTLENKLVTSDAKVLVLTGEKAAVVATAEEKGRAQEIKAAVAESKQADNSHPKKDP